MSLEVVVLFCSFPQFFFRSYIDEILGFPLAAANRLHLLNEIYESFPGLGVFHVFRGEKIQKTLKLSDYPITAYLRRASTIKSPTVSPWSSRTASSCCLAPLWSGSSAGTSTPEQRRAAVKIGPRNVSPHQWHR